MHLLKSPWEESKHLKDAVYSLRIAGKRWRLLRMKHPWIIYRGGDIEMLREATFMAAMAAILERRKERIVRGYKVEINP